MHHRNLGLYKDLGLKVKKVHKVLEFNQSPWLEQYTDFNTHKRTQAKNSYEKDFCKLMNNSLFCKSMENIRKGSAIKLATDKKALIKLSSRPTFVTSKITNDDLVAFHKSKERLTPNRPAYVGMCILDTSKMLI